MTNELAKIDPREMETKINEVQQYFKDKLLAGDFKIQEISEYVLRISIDDEYVFNLWIGNMDIADNMKCYDVYYNFMHLSFTEEERIQLKLGVSDNIKLWRKSILIAQKRAELEKLENEE